MLKVRRGRGRRRPRRQTVDACSLRVRVGGGPGHVSSGTTSTTAMSLLFTTRMSIAPARCIAGKNDERGGIDDEELKETSQLGWVGMRSPKVRHKSLSLCRISISLAILTVDHRFRKESSQILYVKVNVQSESRHSGLSGACSCGRFCRIQVGREAVDTARLQNTYDSDTLFKAFVL